MTKDKAVAIGDGKSRVDDDTIQPEEDLNAIQGAEEDQSMMVSKKSDHSRIEGRLLQDIKIVVLCRGTETSIRLLKVI